MRMRCLVFIFMIFLLHYYERRKVRTMKENKNFSSKLGFVMAAASSAVGLGNLWRFPYLAAKYGGGIFLLVYVCIAVTFGFALMITEIAIGRKTGHSALYAYRSLNKKWGPLGYVSCLVPFIIYPYYCVIGGWVIKYLVVFVRGQANPASQDGYFNGFIGKTWEPITWLALFVVLAALVVMGGVQKGIEKVSKILMPVLIALSIGMAIYIITLPGAGAGVEYYLKPDFLKLNVKVIAAAAGQLFYSMSLAMGIMITYGSYMKKDNNIESSVRQIEIFDTLVAFLSGLIIVPAVFVFSGGNEKALGEGPGLMFVTLPKVFTNMNYGNVIGVLFFILVFFAAITSAISMMETLVSILDEKLKWGRKKVCLLVVVITMIFAIPSSLGFGVLDGIKIMGMSILDFFDFISNSVLMPIVALLTCVLVGYVLKPSFLIQEIEADHVFKAKKFYTILVKFIAPIFLLIILISSILKSLGYMSI